MNPGMERPMDWLDRIIYTVFGALVGGGATAYTLHRWGEFGPGMNPWYIGGAALALAILSGIFGPSLWTSTFSRLPRRGFR